MEKRKIVNIVFISVASALLLAGLVFLFILNMSVKTPAEVVIREENGKIYAVSEINPNNYGYSFKFEGEDGTVIVKSDINVLDISDITTQEEEVIIGRNYKVSVQYNNEIDGGKSRYSKAITWKAKKYLESPTLSQSGNKLVWNEVDGATTYNIYYSKQNNVLIANTMAREYFLSMLTGGINNIFITAESGDQNLLTSMPSNMLQGVQVIHEIQPFDSASYGIASGIVSIVSREKLTSVIVAVNGVEHTVTSLTSAKYGNLYRLTANISFIYETGATLMVKPVGDTYNVYNGTAINVNVVA